MSSPLSLTRQFSDELLEYAMLADEAATRPTPYYAALGAREQRELARFVALSRALVRQGVVVQLALAPYLPIEREAA